MTKHVFRISYNRNWVTSFNLHPHDTNHVDTCAFFLTPVKPTAKQLRQFRKQAKPNIRSWSKKYLPE